MKQTKEAFDIVCEWAAVRAINLKDADLINRELTPIRLCVNHFDEMKELIKSFVNVEDTNSGVWTPMIEPLAKARTLLAQIESESKC